MEVGNSRQLARLRAVRRCIVRCQRAVRDNLGCRFLGSYMFDMIRRGQMQQGERDPCEIERLRDIGERLLARGKREAAAMFINEWIARRLDSVDAHDELASSDLVRFTGYLRELGDTGRAVGALSGYVRLQNQQCWFADKREELVAALRGLEAALREQGQSQSARDTAALADAIEARLHGQGQEALGT